MTATRAVRAAQARADKAESRIALATSTRHQIEGHADGAQAFIATRCNSVGDWAVIDNNAGRRGPDFWDGLTWRPMTREAEAAGAPYRWTQQEAHDLAVHYSALASEAHRHYVSVSRPEFVAWLTGRAEYVMAAVREQVSA